MLSSPGLQLAGASPWTPFVGASRLQTCQSSHPYVVPMPMSFPYPWLHPNTNVNFPQTTLILCLCQSHVAFICLFIPCLCYIPLLCRSYHPCVHPVPVLILCPCI